MFVNSLLSMILVLTRIRTAITNASLKLNMSSIILQSEKTNGIVKEIKTEDQSQDSQNTDENKQENSEESKDEQKHDIANKPEEKTLGATVAKHYNDHPEGTKDSRKESRIFYMRNFNNWVKSVIINEFLYEIKR